MKRRPRPLGLRLVERAEAVEASLWRRLRLDSDGACREMLFDRYLELARAVARGERRRRPAYGLDRADLEQLAFRGLLEAIDRYDPLRGSPFPAYARPRIRGAISDGASHSSETSAQFSARRRIESERLRSLKAGDRDKSAENGEDYLAQLAELAAGIAIGLMAENAAGFHEGAGSGLDAYESLAWRELQINLAREVERLPDRERTVIRQHYLNGVAFSEIARMMGLSKGRISQLHGSALKRVRERLKYSDQG